MLDIIKDIRMYTRPIYNVTMTLKGYLNWIADESEKVDMTPDFQRNRKWTAQQETKYIEHILKGGRTAIDFYFNQPDYTNGNLEDPIVCVDGLQRTTAIQRFFTNQVTVFDGHTLSDLWFNGRPPTESAKELGFYYRVNVNIHDFQTRAEVLQWYLDFNSGGTIHTEEELEHVKVLLDQELKG